MQDTDTEIHTYMYNKSNKGKFSVLYIVYMLREYIYIIYQSCYIYKQ